MNHRRQDDPTAPIRTPAGHTDQTLDGLLSRAYRRTTIGIVILTSLVAFESLAVATAMPLAAAHFEAIAWYALVFASTLAASAIGIALAGAWSDARGAARPTWYAIGALILGLLMSGLADRLWLLLAGRIVQGLGVGAISVTLYVLAATAYPQRLHARALSAMSTAWVVPALVGPAISGLVVSSLGWRWVFLLVAVAGLPAAFLLMPSLRASGRGSGERIFAGANVASALLAAIGLALAHVSGHSQSSAGGFLLLGGLGLLVLGARRLLPPGTTAFARGLPSVIAVRALSAAAFFSAEAFIPLLLIDRYEYSAAAAGLSLTGAALGWAGGAHWHSRRPATEQRPTGPLYTGAAIMCAGLLGVLAVLTLALPASIIVVAWAIMGIGMGMQRPALGVLLIRSSPAGAIGSSASALQMGDAIATAGALAITGAAFAALHAALPFIAYAIVFSASIGLLLLTLVGVARVLPQAEHRTKIFVAPSSSTR